MLLRADESPIFSMLTAHATQRVLPSAPLKFLWLQAMPESRIEMPTPVPSSLVQPVPLSARTPAVPVVVFSVLTVRAVIRLGERLCTSGRAAIAPIWLVGSMAERRHRLATVIHRSACSEHVCAQRHHVRVAAVRR